MNEYNVSNIIELIDKNLSGDNNLDVIQKEVDKLIGVCLNCGLGIYNKIKYVYFFHQDEKRLITYSCITVIFYPDSGANHRFCIDTKGQNKISLYDFDKSVISEEEFNEQYDKCINAIIKRDRK